MYLLYKLLYGAISGHFLEESEFLVVFLCVCLCMFLWWACVKLLPLICGGDQDCMSDASIVRLVVDNLKIQNKKSWMLERNIFSGSCNICAAVPTDVSLFLFSFLKKKNS